MSEETFDYICTPCAEGNLIKEAVKYCLDCQQYCCKDCLTSHMRIAVLKGHSFVENSSVKSQGQPRSIPALPTKQCSKHAGMIMLMYCQDHDAVCCCVCAAEDHRSCKDMMSVSDNIDRLYSKTETSRSTSELSNTLDTLNKWQHNTDTVLQQLENSKVTAIQAVKDHRVKMEELLKKLEKASIKEIENEFKQLESQILEEKKRFQEYIDDMKNLQQFFTKASGNIAQLFICTKLAKKNCTTIEDKEMKEKRFKDATIKFLPSEKLQSSMEKMKHLGEVSAILSSKYNMYKATKIHDMNVKIKEDKAYAKCTIIGSCIMADAVLFTDWENSKLKRFDVSSLSLIDYCVVPDSPRGVCQITDKEVAVACQKVVQFVSVDDKISLLQSIQMKHKNYGIAHSNDKLYITDQRKSLYMYNMSGNLMKTITQDSLGQPLFGCSNHITFNDNKNRLFVGDDKKGLVSFNAECDYIETVRDPGIRPDGVCVDDHGNIIVANFYSNTIVQCDRDGQKCGIIVNTTQKKPRCVCIHPGQRKMFVGFSESNTVEVYSLTYDLGKKN